MVEISDTRSVRGKGLQSRYLGKVHTEYCVRVSVNGREWLTWRRYKEFVALHQTLSSPVLKDYAVCDTLLPSKNLKGGNLKAVFVEQRRCVGLICLF